ncbi:MAG TPA: hypothetical protein VEH30_19015 [Terriglobales bacterium]|nr:hypothetical protein [Terriglobales bacterium]
MHFVSVQFVFVFVGQVGGFDLVHDVDDEPAEAPSFARPGRAMHLE